MIIERTNTKVDRVEDERFLVHIDYENIGTITVEVTFSEDFDPMIPRAELAEEILMGVARQASGF